MTEGKNKKKFKKNEIVLLSALGLLFYFAVVIKMLLLPEYENLKASSIKLQNATVEYEHIKSQVENIQELQAKVVASKEELLKEAKKMPPVIDRERVLLSMCNYAKTSRTTIESYSFSGMNIYPFEGFTLGSETGNTPIEPSQVKPDAEVLIVSSVEMSFTAYEDGLYKFLKAFESSEPSLYLKSCSIESSLDTGELVGAIVMEYVAYKGKLAEYSVDLGLTLPKGKQEVFPSASQIIEQKQLSEMERIKFELEKMNSETVETPVSNGQ